MSGSNQQAPPGVRRALREQMGRLKVRQALVGCGILYAVLYPFVNDVIAAALYPGYSRLSQAVSELSATGAAPKAFLMAVSPLFTLLQIGFGVGMWQSARGKRSVRIAGALMVVHGVMSPLWMFAPMSQRQVIAAGRATSGDTMHLVLAAGTGLFVAAYVAVLAVAFGWFFRAYSVLTLAIALVFGRLSAQVDHIRAGDPTPYMGLLERIGIGAWLLWMAVASVALNSTERGARGASGSLTWRRELFCSVMGKRSGRDGGHQRERSRAVSHSDPDGTAPLMARVTGRIVIDRPIEDVFDAVADQTNEPRYNPSMTDSRQVTDGPIGVGTRFLATILSRGKPMKLDIEVTRYERPSVLGSRSEMAGSTVVGELRLEPVAAGTRFSWDWELTVGGAARLLGPLVAIVGRRREQAIWTGLKDWLENGSTTIARR